MHETCAFGPQPARRWSTAVRFERQRTGGAAGEPLLAPRAASAVPPRVVAQTCFGRVLLGDRHHAQAVHVERREVVAIDLATLQDGELGLEQVEAVLEIF